MNTNLVYNVRPREAGCRSVSNHMKVLYPIWQAAKWKGKLIKQNLLPPIYLIAKHLQMIYTFFFVSLCPLILLLAASVFFRVAVQEQEQELMQSPDWWQ